MEIASVLNYVFIAFGFVLLVSSFFNWDWIFNKQKRAGFFKLLDKNGSRVFNFMLGLLMLLVGSFDYIFPLLR